MRTVYAVLGWFCAGATAGMTVFTLLAGWVTRGTVGQLIVIGGWMWATTVVSLMRSAARSEVKLS